ncbi:RMD1 family protein [Microvirga massiliensis]|uniref:RMD1 family protein n=1 Tax=Microvirga massiliensis TaxID=1033741 RepID=UPI00062B5E69|nr:RMD1 family protein [Microvirga massiliensis]
MAQPEATRPKRLAARALLVSDRIDLMGLERADVLATNPLAFRAGEGFVVLFRYGVAVLVGLTPLEEDEVLRNLQPRISGPLDKVEETAEIEIAPDQEDGKIPPGGPIQVRDLSPDRLVVIADALAKSAALSRDEQEVSAVFDVIEPHARRLAERGRAPRGLRTILKLIGNALIVRHRVSGRVAVEEKPDVLWDRPDLERLYARLEDEYELRERAGDLHRKLTVIGQTATALSDLIHTERSLRLEVIIVALILFEVLVTIYQLVSGAH